MSRYVALIALLVLLSGVMGLAASVLPVAGAYALRESTDMAPITFGKENDYNTLKQPLASKPASLTIKAPEEFEASKYYELRLGSPALSRYLLAGRTKGKWFDALYFDADGNGVIAPEERLKTLTRRIELGLVPGSEADKYEFWLTEPVEPLRVIMNYKRANGTAYTRILTYDLQVASLYSSGLVKGENPVALTSVTLATWFVGEVHASGDRVLKMAIVDGNQNGLFNEAKEDFYLVDENRDSRFDWAKEREPLGGDLYGVGADGKKLRVVPAVAAWPRNLCLVPKGTAPDPAILEAE